MSGVDNWREPLVAALEARDRQEKESDELFVSFDLLYKRLQRNEELLSKVSRADIRELDSTFNDNQDLRKVISKHVLTISTQEKDINRLKTKINTQQKEIKRLNTIITSLTNKLNRQTEEYHHKNKSIELITDEFLSMEIQNNLLYDKLGKLETENKLLIKRWMDKVQEDVDKINDSNELHTSR